MPKASDIASHEEDMSASDRHVIQCMESWIADPDNSPSELLKAMQEFINAVVIQSHPIH